MVKKRQGFTLVELSLSMIFIGTLSVMVMVVINNTVLAYQRGMTLNQINTVGMDLVDDMRSAVQNSSSGLVTTLCTDYYKSGAEREKCEEDGGDSFVRLTQYVNEICLDKDCNERIGDGGVSQIPVSGVFCTGSYSYIWNSGYYFKSDLAVEGWDADKQLTSRRAPLGLKWGNEPDKQTGLDDNGEPVRLLKVRDDTRMVCASVMMHAIMKKSGVDLNAAHNNYMTQAEVQKIVNDEKILSGGYIDISDAFFPRITDENRPIEVLTRDTYNDIVLYDLETAEPALSTTRRNMFYSVSFILGTSRGGINILARGNNCKPPEGYSDEDFDYCAINKFSFAVQANGASSKGAISKNEQMEVIQNEENV